MDWIRNLNNALEYIESNLTGELDQKTIASRACSSKFNFLRVFSILSGKSLGEYIRERRLTLAGKDLLDGKEKVIDIALKYGYEDPGAFSKAFSRFHGVTPTQAQTRQRSLKAAPPLKFVIEVKGEEKMDYRIEKLKGFAVRGISREFTYKDGENYRDIPKFWQELNSSGVMAKTIIPNITQKGLYGICYDSNDSTKDMKYLIGVEGSTKTDILDTVLDIEEKTWAIFRESGPMPGAIQNLWRRIFNEWLPGTNYNLADGPQMEVYLGDDPGNKDSEFFEIWVPVVED